MSATWDEFREHMRRADELLAAISVQRYEPPRDQFEHLRVLDALGRTIKELRDGFALLHEAVEVLGQRLARLEEDAGEG